MKPRKRAGPRPDLDECKTLEFLYHHLVVLGKSKKELADELGVSQATMNAWTASFDFGVNFHSRSNLGKQSFPLSEETKRLLSVKIKQQYLEGRQPTNYKGRQVRTCEICGSPFEVILNSENEKQRNKTTCNKVCADKLHSLYMQSRPKVSKLQVTCVQCGESFEVWPSLSHLQFCSYDCARAHRRGKTYEELYGPDKTMQVKQRLAQARARQSRSHTTRAVAALKDALIPLLGEPEVEYVIGQYAVDLCYTEIRLVIEVDGNYWHHFPFGLVRDKRKTRDLENMGWKVFREWESKILADPTAVAMRIKEMIDHAWTIPR